MIDAQYIQTLVESQIKTSVEQHVESILSDEKWLDQLEKKIVDHVRDRITARFANISTIPDLVDTVKLSVKNLLEQGSIPGIEQFVDQQVIKNTMHNAIDLTVQKALDNLVMDVEWLSKIESHSIQRMTSKVTNALSEFDFNSVLVSEIDKGMERWRHKFAENFATKGIIDQADQIELTVLNGVVVVENDLVTKDIQVENNATIKNTLSVKDLVVTGVINTDNASWNEISKVAADKALELINDIWKQELVEQVTELVRHGIDFDNVTINGRPLLEGSKLNADITDSNLRSVGILHNLSVEGLSSLANTAFIDKGRLGINTKTPEMALSIWDDDVSIILGKLKSKEGFIGTSRGQSLSLGVNRTAFVEIDTEGLTSIKKLRVDRHRVSFETQVPGYSGTRGDIVFNADPKPKTPFAWVCLGGFQWQSLKSA